MKEIECIREEPGMDMMNCPFMSCPLLQWGLANCPAMQLISTGVTPTQCVAPIEDTVNKQKADFMEGMYLREWYEDDERFFSSGE